MSLNEAKCWAALGRRDAANDGKFYFGVMTTGVYCRPSCPARQPLRKNVRFYEAAGDAERDGLRPCKRCRPLAGRADEETVAKIGAICAYIKERSNDGESVTLTTLARRIGWSGFHLQRTFKAVLGITPKQFLDGYRISTFKKQLKGGSSVTNAVYEAGFSSSSRVYESASETLGMTPAQYREGGKNVAVSYAYAATPLGLVMIGATDRGLCFAQFGESEASLMREFKSEYPEAQLFAGDAGQQEMKDWMEALTQYLAGERVALDLPIDVRASVFQMKVWRYLRTIPRGETRTYGEVAEAIGEAGAARAVGTACGANRIALAIPCHRVIRGDGALGGYRWGMRRKEALLKVEKNAIDCTEEVVHERNDSPRGVGGRERSNSRRRELAEGGRRGASQQGGAAALP